MQHEYPSLCGFFCSPLLEETFGDKGEPLNDSVGFSSFSHMGVGQY